MNAAERVNGSRRLSDAELELLIDGAVAPDQAERVERTLAASPADAARLTQLRAADARMLTALVDPPAREGVVSRRRSAAPFVAAAAALVLSGVALLVRFGGGSPTPTPVLVPPIATTSDLTPAEYEPVRVVLSMAAPTRDRKPKETVKAADKPSHDADPVARPANVIAGGIASAFGDATDSGIRRAVSAINDASPDDRAAALATLGQTLRSGSTAVRILDKLGPRDQVAVCSELALDASLRAVALQRLRDLADNPDVGADARAAVRALAAAPGMKTWLRSYGLLEDLPKPASLEDATPDEPTLG